jgi:tripeptide aminopeptidase
MINKERLVDEFMELVRYPSVSGNERALADVLIGRLRDLGLEVVEDNAGQKLGWAAGNVFARWPASVPGSQALLFCAHMDHVPPGENIEPYISDGAIRARGQTVLGADDKAGIVPIMEALRVIHERRMPHGELEILFTIGEENGLNGVKNMDAAMLKAKLGYVLDTSGDVGKIITQAPFHHIITATIYGKAAHAGLEPEKGINAIQVAGVAVAQLKAGRIDAETTANVGLIHGGKAINIIPEYVEIQCEARSLNLRKLEEQTKHMQEVFTGTARQWGARAEVEVENQYQGYSLDEQSPVINLAVQAARKIGLNPTLCTTGGGSDANFLNYYGLPTTVLGVGMRKVHTTEEFIYIKDLVSTTEYVLSIIETALENGL